MTNFQGGSAKIFTFPARGRFAEARPRNDATALDAGRLPCVTPVVCGDNWYHDEAIREAEARKNKPAH